MCFFFKRKAYYIFILSYQFHDCLVFFNQCSYYNYSRLQHVMYLSNSNRWMIFYRSNIYIFLCESNKSLYMVNNEYLISSMFNLKKRKIYLFFMYQSVINVTSNCSTCFSIILYFMFTG